MEFIRRGAAAPVLTLASLMLLAGCNGGNSALPSNWFPASSIYAYMRAVQDESGSVTTTVQLRDGPTSTANYLYLSSGETLYASLDKSPIQAINFNGNLFVNSLELSQNVKVMSQRDLMINYGVFTDVLYGKPEYFSFDKPGTNSTPVRAYIGFERSGHEMAGESSIELPPAFQILSPANGSSLPRITPVALTWTPGTDTTTSMELDVAGVCTDNSQFSLHLILGADTGSATLNSADYFPSTVSPSIDCFVAFLLQRVRLGSVSSPFAFGSFSKGVQQRPVTFTSTPN